MFSRLHDAWRSFSNDIDTLAKWWARGRKRLSSGSLREFWRTGAVSVVTYDPQGAQERVLVKSVVQLDADLLNFVHPDALTPAFASLVEAHWGKVRAAILPLQKVGAAFRVSTRGAVAAWTIGWLYSAPLSRGVDIAWAVVRWAVVTAALLALGHLVLRIVQWRWLRAANVSLPSSDS